MGKLYCIGGSPCCGKSTLTRRLAKEKGFYHFEADEYMEYAVMKGKKDGRTQCIRQADVYGDAKWLRDPMVQAKEELALYREIFPYVMEVLERKCEEYDVIAEGAVFMPELMEQKKEKVTKYCCMMPEEKFQIRKYRERSWVKAVLKGSASCETAFDYWMRRDVLFAKEIEVQAVRLDIPYMIINGNAGLDAVYERLLRILLI